MTALTSDLRAIVTEARPLIEAWLETAEKMAALRDAATDRGIDWSQLKALLKAQILDEQDGKDRLKRLVEKAESATAYADMLGMGQEKYSASEAAE